MHNSPHHINHQRNKEIRHTTRASYKKNSSDPKTNIFAKASSHIKSIAESIRKKKSKSHSKRSRFQNPDEVDHRTVPESVTKMNRRKIGMYKYYTLAKAKSLYKYFSKKKFHNKDLT